MPGFQANLLAIRVQVTGSTWRSAELLEVQRAEQKCRPVSQTWRPNTGGLFYVYGTVPYGASCGVYGIGRFLMGVKFQVIRDGDVSYKRNIHVD